MAILDCKQHSDSSNYCNKKIPIYTMVGKFEMNSFLVSLKA